MTGTDESGRDRPGPAPLAGLPSAADIAATDDPRERLVSAATVVLFENFFGVVSEGLRPDAVTAAAGRSRRVFYDHFEDRADVLRAVANRFFTAGPGTVQARLIELGDAFDLVEGDLTAGLRMLVGATFAETLASARTTMRTIAWCLARGDEEIAEGLRAHHRHSDAVIGALLDDLNASVGLRYRPPWTGETMAAVLRALGDGLYLRHHLAATSGGDPAHDEHRSGADGNAESLTDPASDPEVLDLLVLTALSMLPTATESTGSAVVPVAEHLDGFTRAVSAAWREGVDAGELIDARDRVLQSLRAIVAASGPEISLEAVAHDAGLSMRSVVAAFGSLAELTETAIEESLPALEREAAFDLAGGDIERRDMVRRHLLRIGQWARGEPELARLWLWAVAGSADGIERAYALRITARLAGPLVGILTDGGDIAVEDRDHVRPTAVMVSNVMVGRMAADPDHQIDETARWLTDVVLRTLRPG